MARFNNSVSRQALQELRVARGIELYRRRRIRFPYRNRGDGLRVGKDLFGVLSETRDDVMYIVERVDGRWACTCQDYAKNGEWLGLCKHIAAVLAWRGELRCVACGAPAGRKDFCEACLEAAAAAQAETDARYDLGAALF